jgi:hypothetical protein
MIFSFFDTLQMISPFDLDAVVYLAASNHGKNIYPQSLFD